MERVDQLRQQLTLPPKSIVNAEKWVATGGSGCPDAQAYGMMITSPISPANVIKTFGLQLNSEWKLSTVNLESSWVRKQGSNKDLVIISFDNETMNSYFDSDSVSKYLKGTDNQSSTYLLMVMHFPNCYLER